MPDFALAMPSGRVVRKNDRKGILEEIEADAQVVEQMTAAVLNVESEIGKTRRSIHSEQAGIDNLKSGWKERIWAFADWWLWSTQ